MLIVRTVDVINIGRRLPVAGLVADIGERDLKRPSGNHRLRRAAFICLAAFVCVAAAGCGRKGPLEAHPDDPAKTRLVGDCHYDTCAAVAGAITPVPGGVGPMTIACLLANTLTACCRAHGLDEPVGLTA